MPSLEKKYKALNLFKKRLLESEVGDQIARIILYGSVLKGTADENSDIDVLIIGFGPIEEIRRISSDIAYNIFEDLEERIEPMVYCYDEYLYPHYFINLVKKKGEEIYSMEEDAEKKKYAGEFLGLAYDFIESAKYLLKGKFYRNAVDAAYNASELLVKALLVLVLDELPKTHSGVVQMFGKHYVKTKRVDRKLNRLLQQGLEWRNSAGYDPHATITEEQAEKLIELAESLYEISEREILS